MKFLFFMMRQQSSKIINLKLLAVDRIKLVVCDWASPPDCSQEGTSRFLFFRFSTEKKKFDRFDDDYCSSNYSINKWRDSIMWMLCNFFRRFRIDELTIEHNQLLGVWKWGKKTIRWLNNFINFRVNIMYKVHNTKWLWLYFFFLSKSSR
jgi:hypothetical protein